MHLVEASVCLFTAHFKLVPKNFLQSSCNSQLRSFIGPIRVDVRFAYMQACVGVSGEGGGGAIFKYILDSSNGII